MKGHLSQSGFPLEPVYNERSLDNLDLATDVGEPGEHPYTRGIHPGMYRERLWTMREYAGYSTAAESNARYHALIAEGGTGLSVAFDLPTQMGYDSDHPLAEGEVGRVGVAIDSLEDMRRLFEGIRLDAVTTSMTINSPASVLLLLYELVAEEQGVDVAQISGTVQNDILKEYIARGTYIYPPAGALRLTTDLFAYCQKELPRWNTISISGYHMAEAGATPAQELGFTFANAIEYVDAALAAGLTIDEFAPRLSFFFVARTQLLEEVAKFRAARRIWARIMTDRYKAGDPQSAKLRFHTQTAGVQLTAQQPQVNFVRVTLAALAAVLGGTQSLHTNAYDEALALPTEESARLALRTQQVLAYETDLTDIVDPFGGSYAIESITDALEKEATEIMRQVAELGGAKKAIELGFQKAQIEQSAYQIEKEIESEQRVVVGVNRFVTSQSAAPVILEIDPQSELDQVRRVKELRARRDSASVASALAELKETAEGDGNVLYPMKEALSCYATVGEVCDTLREVWGVYRPVEKF
jgi:methylmalonyl-CoA mutase, N-terminal domain